MDYITLRKDVDDYKTVYMHYSNFYDRTRIEYQNDLENLITFLEERDINHVKELGLPIIERYVAHLEQEGFASLTRKRKVVAIRSFISFCFKTATLIQTLRKELFYYLPKALVYESVIEVDIKLSRKVDSVRR